MGRGLERNDIPVYATGNPGLEGVMVGVLPAVGYACLVVALHVTEPTQVELTAQEHVRVDRITGVVLELVPPGTTTLRLDRGTYVLRTTRDAQLLLADASAVQISTVPLVKDPTPDPPSLTFPLPMGRGDSAPDHTPTLTVR